MLSVRGANSIERGGPHRIHQEAAQVWELQQVCGGHVVLLRECLPCCIGGCKEAVAAGRLVYDGCQARRVHGLAGDAQVRLASEVCGQGARSGWCLGQAPALTCTQRAAVSTLHGVMQLAGQACPQSQVTSSQSACAHQEAQPAAGLQARRQVCRSSSGRAVRWTYTT